MIKEKNILIIGGSSGIGLALAEILSPINSVYIASRSRENLTNLEVTHIPYDATTQNLEISSLPDTVDGFVYCPGSINLRPFKGLSSEAFEKDFQINVIGAVNSLKSILSNLSNSGNASVVFFSTVAVQTGMPFHSSVASSKGAIEGLTRSLAAEFAPKIRVNCIAPSLTDSKMSQKMVSNENIRKAIENMHPIPKIGQGEDFGDLSYFLLSQKNSWITGQIFHIDGGRSTLRIKG